MFKNKKADFSQVDTVVGINAAFDGNIKSEGSLRVDGKVKGNIDAQGDVYIGDSAVVTGNINANNVNLSGRVEGNITTKGILRLLSTARLFGDISVNSFVADEGGIFQGKCNMEDPSFTPSKSSDTTVDPVNIKKGSSGKDFKKSSVINTDEETSNASA